MIDGTNHKLSTMLFIIFATFFIITISWLVINIFSPPSWEAGACWGGYVTSIFHKYEATLLDMYIQGLNSDDVISAEIVAGSHSGYEANKLLHLKFDVALELETGDTIVRNVNCIGTKYWIESYNWDLE